MGKPQINLARAADHVGGQTKLAEILTRETARAVSQQWVWSAINRDSPPVPAEWCLPIERATEGKVTRHDLRPDLYPTEQGEAA